jgi:hypothetical protein
MPTKQEGCRMAGYTSCITVADKKYEKLFLLYQTQAFTGVILTKFGVVKNPHTKIFVCLFSTIY